MTDKSTPGWQCLLRGQEKFYADGGKDGLLGTYQAREVDEEIARLRRIIEQTSSAVRTMSPLSAGDAKTLLLLLEIEDR